MCWQAIDHGAVPMLIATPLMALMLYLDMTLLPPMMLALFGNAGAGLLGISGRADRGHSGGGGLLAILVPLLASANPDFRAGLNPMAGSSAHLMLLGAVLALPVRNR